MTQIKGASCPLRCKYTMKISQLLVEAPAQKILPQDFQAVIRAAQVAMKKSGTVSARQSTVGNQLIWWFTFELPAGSILPVNAALIALKRAITAPKGYKLRLDHSDSTKLASGITNGVLKYIVTKK